MCEREDFTKLKRMDWHVNFGSKVVQVVAAVLITLFLQFLIYHFTALIVRHLVKRTKGETKLDEKKREDTIIGIIRATAVFLLWFMAICAVFTILGVNVAALLTGAGLIGVFVGLSAQNTVKDVLAGMFILLEKQYRIGDIITFSGGTLGPFGPTGVTGTVQEITLRITKLRDESGKLVIVRNGEPTVTFNQTTSASGIILDLKFTYETDVDAAMKLINEIGAVMAKDEKWANYFSVPISSVRVDSFIDTGVVIRASGMVEPASQWEVAGEYRRRLLKAAAKRKDIHFAYGMNV